MALSTRLNSMSWSMGDGGDSVRCGMPNISDKDRMTGVTKPEDPSRIIAMSDGRIPHTAKEGGWVGREVVRD